MTLIGAGLTVLGLSLMLGWTLQRKRTLAHRYVCSRCRTEVRSNWEISKRCPACTRPWAPMQS